MPELDGRKAQETLSQMFFEPLRLAHEHGVTVLPGLTTKFGTSRNGVPINVQPISSWQAESTIVHLAALLEGVSPVRDLHPDVK